MLKFTTTLFLLAFLLGCNAHKTDLVLSIGDSISMGYLPHVKNNLPDNLSLYHPPENCRNSWYQLQRIDLWLAIARRPKIIIWNVGIWNTLNAYSVSFGGDPREQGTSLEQYEYDLRAIALKLKDTGAKVIFFNTTWLSSNTYTDIEKVDQLNDIANRVLVPMGIEVQDLNTISRTLQHTDGIHYSDEGYKILGEFVASKVKSAIQ